VGNFDHFFTEVDLLTDNSLEIALSEGREGMFENFLMFMIRKMAQYLSELLKQ